MSLKDQISADLKEAMKARDQIRVDTLRALMSAFTYKKVAAGEDVSDEDQLSILQKQVKQRNDSIAEFTKAGRTDLIEKETKERDILTKYLPTQKSEEEIRQLVREIIEGLAADARNQGAVMKLVMPRVKGLADGNMVRQIVTDEITR